MGKRGASPPTVHQQRGQFWRWTGWQERPCAVARAGAKRVFGTFGPELDGLVVFRAAAVGRCGPADAAGYGGESTGRADFCSALAVRPA